MRISNYLKLEGSSPKVSQDIKVFLEDHVQSKLNGQIKSAKEEAVAILEERVLDETEKLWEKTSVELQKLTKVAPFTRQYTLQITLVMRLEKTTGMLLCKIDPEKMTATLSATVGKETLGKQAPAQTVGFLAKALKDLASSATQKHVKSLPKSKLEY